MKPVFDENGLAIEAGNIRCFYYCPVTGEYTGWSDEYINIGVSMPGNSTDIDPGEFITGKVAIFNGKGWEQKEDYRGVVVYSTADKSSVTVDYIGKVSDGYTSIPPSNPFDTWNGNKWVTDTAASHDASVEAADAEKQSKINQANTHINTRQWPGKAAMGRLKDTEKEQYNLWLDYLDELEAVDTSSSPDINWPIPPGV